MSCGCTSERRASYALPALGESIVGVDWTSAPTVGVEAVPAEIVIELISTGAPVVGQDASGLYIGPGTAVIASGELEPCGPITRITMGLNLADGGLVRVLLPYADQQRYGVLEVTRTGAEVRMVVYVADPLVSTHMAVAASPMLGALDGNGRITVECGPRFLRAWWGRLAGTWHRSTPDVGAYIPEIDQASWGFLSFGAMIRDISIDRRPTEGADTDRLKLIGERDEGVELPQDDTSTAVLLTYLVAAQTSRRRGEVCVQASADSTCSVADSIFHRVDPTQTIVLLPPGSQTSMRVSTLGEMVSGPSSGTLNVTPTGDPTSGLDGGIGSGRTDLTPGGELCLELPLVLAEGSSVEHAMIDQASETGGREAYDQIASRQLRTWGLKAKVRPTQARLAERVTAAAGGARPVWMLPPLEGWPVAVTVPGISHRTPTHNVIQVDMTAREA